MYTMIGIVFLYFAECIAIIILVNKNIQIANDNCDNVGNILEITSYAIMIVATIVLGVVFI